ncbi:MAG: co-chaperone DjlA [Proteobacteria bacterium]|nr:co-chaperone DjlA [Pseudomonadota bacterium]
MTPRQFFSSNRWTGKLIGAFIGYIIGGPVAAFFGILIGNLFDKGALTYYNRPHWSYHTEKRQAVQNIFFEATFTIMGRIAKADGRVSEEEINVAKRLMGEMRLNKQQKGLAQQYFGTGKAADFDVVNILLRLKEACRYNPELLKLFVDIQYKAAQTDGLSTSKINALDQVLKILGFAPLNKQQRFYDDFDPRGSTNYRSNSENSYSSYQNRGDILSQAYAILELNPSSTKQEVKKAYRRLISKNHPDKLIAQGLPEEMIKLANEKTQKITKAYEQICEAKGW